MQIPLSQNWKPLDDIQTGRRLERHGQPGSAGLYLQRQADSLGRYVLEQSLQTLAGWMPTLVGIGLRAILYRLMLTMEGSAAIEPGVRLRFASHIRLGAGSYLDQGVYIHACPNGVTIGPRTLVMHGSILHVYNFRNLPHAGITIGADSLIGEIPLNYDPDRCLVTPDGQYLYVTQPHEAVVTPIRLAVASADVIDLRRLKDVAKSHGGAGD